MLYKLFGKFKLKFEEGKDHVCTTCDHVKIQKQHILKVSRGHNGELTFLCGAGSHSKDDLTEMTLGEIFKRDETINALYNMPKGYGAVRKNIKDNWAPQRLK